MDLSATIHLLGDILGSVISELESPQAFELEEKIRNLAKQRRAGDSSAGAALEATVARLPPDTARAMASAFAVYFDLVNLAEEDYRVSLLRGREAGREAGVRGPLDESIEEAIASLSQVGVTAQEMGALLDNLDIELVLTAHPTEAKRRTILSKLQRIAQHVRELNAPDALPRELAAHRAGIRSEIASLWLTEHARTVRPTVTDEVRTGLFFIDEVFWEVLPRVYEDLDAALDRYYPGLRTQHTWLRLASWIGGDRDGNPNVTTEVTAETLRLHRGLAIEHFRRSFQDLARRLSLSVDRLPPPPALQAWLQGRRPFPSHVAYLESRYGNEPYRLVLSLLAADLADASAEDMTAHLLSSAPYAARVGLADFTMPLDLVADAIPSALAEAELAALRRQLEVFGLHAARLDVREHSERLAAALAEVLRALDITPDFDRADGQARRAVLVRLLAEPAPALAEQVGVTSQTAQTWSLFKLIGRVRCVFGPRLLGPFVISMTHAAADVLTVLLLARWTGCADGLQIAPLFETREDLESAPRILSELFEVGAYREHLAATGNDQMIMVGYSDSNKDAGYLAANWALYQAQENIARTCDAYGVRLTFFHGRGGTVARGGGPANRAVRAQPAGTVRGHLRVTEQGEIIAARYSNRDLAHRHLEQLTHAVLLSSSPRPLPGEMSRLPTAWREAMAALSDRGWRAYRTLVYETPGFLDFWQEATPIDEIMRLQIGSRPASRRSGSLDLSEIRAIPWVFSWMQSRFNLPGWYGLGSGLRGGTGGAGSRDDTASLALEQEMYAGWPFFRALLDNAEMALLKADMDIAGLYAGLVADRELADRIFRLVQEEHERTRSALLAITGHAELLDAEPVIQRSVHLRNPYVDPLNYIQVEMLRRLRSLSQSEGSSAVALRQVVVLTINGIAAGLRNTG